MNRAELVAEMRDGRGLTTVDANAAVDGFVGAVLKALKGGDTVDIKGFGSFATKRTEARTARNPFNGGTVDVPAKTVPTFKFTKTFKEQINAPKKTRSRL